jgi:hypothetical protein
MELGEYEWSFQWTRNISVPAISYNSLIFALYVSNYVNFKIVFTTVRHYSDK